MNPTPPITSPYAFAVAHIQAYTKEHGHPPDEIYAHPDVIRDIGGGYPGEPVTFFGIPLLPSTYGNPGIMGSGI